MKKIKTEEAVGHVLCHDLTRIIKGVEKGAAFRKGHVVTKEDIPKLLDMGKEHLYVWEKEEGMLHENEGADILWGLCKNKGIAPTPVKEGKIDMVAEHDGLFVVDVERLFALNSLGEMMIATRHTMTPVKKGEKLAGCRVIPLVIGKEKLERAKAVVGEAPLLSLLPYRPYRVGIVTTGSEVYHGRIQDTFTPVVKEKVAAFGMEVMAHLVVDDEKAHIAQAVEKLLGEGAELILCTGGMSVDPDDCTPGAIAATGAQVVSYGSPVLPGAMLLVAYAPDGTPILGLPGCVMYAKRTVFDLVLPRIAAGRRITKEELARLGHGGLCLQCESCHYPACSFGKVDF